MTIWQNITSLMTRLPLYSKETPQQHEKKRGSENSCVHWEHFWFNSTSTYRAQNWNYRGLCPYLPVDNTVSGSIRLNPDGAFFSLCNEVAWCQKYHYRRADLFPRFPPSFSRDPDLAVPTPTPHSSSSSLATHPATTHPQVRIKNLF